MKQTFRLASAAVLAAALAGTAVGSAAAAPLVGGNQGSGTHDRSLNRAKAAVTAELSAAAPQATAPVYRVQGADRIATAVAASKAIWDNAGSNDGPTATAVVISRFDEYADALGGSALAGAVGGPLLLTHSTYVDAATLNEVDRLLGGRGDVYLLGGTGAISAAAEKTLRGKGYTIKRLGGADRYETSVNVSVAVAKAVPSGHPQFIFATTGENFPDGLAAGATAGGYAASVVLTKDNVLPKVVKTYLAAEQGAGTDVLAVGGATAQAPLRFAGTVVGADRFETAALIADAFWGDPGSDGDDPTAIALATGEDWPDALAGGSLVATLGPLLLTKPSTLPASTLRATTSLVRSASPSPVQVGFVLGGTAVVSDGVKNAFAKALNP